MKKKILSSIFVTVLLLSTSITVLAETGKASVTGYDLVDSGGHMDYTMDTKYDSYVWGAAQTWNSYLNDTVIREDTRSTINDCDIYDVTQSDVSWVGLTGIPTNLPISGYMKLNTYYMDQYSTTKIILVIKHEFGHTLGCDENDCDENNIMYPNINMSKINLTIHDKASVDLAKKSW